MSIKVGLTRERLFDVTEVAYSFSLDLKSAKVKSHAPPDTCQSVVIGTSYRPEPIKYSTWSSDAKMASVIVKVYGDAVLALHWVKSPT